MEKGRNEMRISERTGKVPRKRRKKNKENQGLAEI